MKVELVQPQGYCAGVMNAIKIAYLAKSENADKRVFVLGALVHNQTVIDELKNNNVETLESGDEINAIKKLNKGDVLIFTAHGHDEKLDEVAKNQGLIIYDATCPKVRSNMEKIKQEIKAGHQVIYIGQKGHKETNAALSISKDVSLYDTQLLINYQLITDKTPLVINQTTLNFFSLNTIHEDIKKHIPEARIENEVCAASRLRQAAVANISKDNDLIIIVGDKTSSNSLKLFDIAKENFPTSMVIMVHDLEDLKNNYNIEGKKKAAISSGASTPNTVVQEIYQYLLSK